MTKRPTLEDVAKLAGVSKSTAARVLNRTHEHVREETRARVMAVVQKLGYERDAIAGSLRSKHTYLIAVSIPDITNPYWPPVVRGIQDVAEAFGYSVVLLNNDWNPDREASHLRQMRQKQFDGLIINPTTIQNADLLRLNIPVVLLDSGESFPDFDTVSSDSIQATRLAMEHLIELGHRRIGLIMGQSRRGKSQLHRDTYIRELKSHHLSPDPSLIAEADFSIDGGFTAMQRLLALSRRPTAVFAINDMLALGALQAAQAAGLRVPEQISIIGKDDIFASETAFPALTTIARPRYDIGATAARFLLERIENKSVALPRHPLIPCILIPRRSTAAP